MLFEEQKSWGEDAARAVERAGMGVELDPPQSTVLGPFRSSVMVKGTSPEVPEKLNRPDRPYNLACTYARVAADLTDAWEKSRYERMALNELAKCMAMANDGPVSNMGSKAYFKRYSSKDSDLRAIRNLPRFTAMMR